MAHTLIKKKQTVQCNHCNKVVPYIVKKAKMFGEYERLYAECNACSYQKTVYYTNKRLRKLLSKQDKETNHAKKLLLKDKIEKEMAMLKARFEG